MTLIYDENGQLLWAQRDVPWLMKMIQPDWLKSNGFHEIEAEDVYKRQQRWFKLKREEVETTRLPLTVRMFAESAEAGKWLYQ